MSENFVTVTGQWQDFGGDTVDTLAVAYGEGNWLFNVSGELNSSPSVAIVVPVMTGQLDALGALSVPGATANSGIPLLASDNFASGQLTWHFLIRVRGQADIDVSDIPVNFSNGASQGIFTILQSVGWTQVST